MPEMQMNPIPSDWDYPLGKGGGKSALSGKTVTIENVKMTDTKPGYKYEEDRILTELKEYIDATYGQHYSKNKFQATEFIIDSGHGTGFCVGNILKYAQRYGRKGRREEWRKDMLKVIHYAMMQLYVHDNES